MPIASVRHMSDVPDLNLKAGSKLGVELEAVDGKRRVGTDGEHATLGAVLDELEAAAGNHAADLGRVRGRQEEQQAGREGLDGLGWEQHDE